MFKQTPLMKQYWSIKSAHQDQLLLFRMGDFFELFHDDARTAAPVIGITLTCRNKKAADETAMCGVPHHSVAGPINKLLAAGFKVAICDQIEDPKLAKGIVKRAVTRILSPGMVYDPDTLDGQMPNYLCSYDEDSLSFLDATTGDAFYFQNNSTKSDLKANGFATLIEVLSPLEIVLNKKFSQLALKEKTLQGPTITEYDSALEVDYPQFEDLPTSAKRLVSYAVYMQGKEVLNSILGFEKKALRNHLELSPTVIEHLEVFQTNRGDVKGSLFYAINRTKTSSGARLLKSYLRFPLVDAIKINSRWDEIEHWVKHHNRLEHMRKLLGQMGDLERRMGKIASPNCAPRDLMSLHDSLAIGLELVGQSNHWQWDQEQVEAVQKIVVEIESTLTDEPPLNLKKGGVIRKGFSAQLDEYIDLSDDGQKSIIEMEAREKKQTGISSLKIRYNNVFGYYIEVTKTHQAKVPEHYVRKQTLTTAERYITEDLTLLESKILSAKTKRLEIEDEIFSQLKNSVLSHSRQILQLAKKWSELDVFSSMAWLSVENNYHRPEINFNGEFTLELARHPVVEQMVNRYFVPNNFNFRSGECLLLTGPNMAGKSTLMRQIAVISLMTQAGLFVPAKKASVPLYNRIFTRIGASDSLSEGLSTFMVEMSETAEMLKSADGNSLVVLDEIGRGTSTYDGLSLAQAILEYLLIESGSLTLFATHYHELTQLSLRYPQVKNAHMSIREQAGEMEFLYTLVKGSASKSYGIHVAKLAGIPAKVTRRAQSLLKKFEMDPQNSLSSSQLSLADMLDADNMDNQVDFLPAEESFSGPNQEFVDELREISIDKMTPMDALNKIATWQKHLS